MSNELVVRNGKTCRAVPTGYTVRQYFSHSTPEKGPGPGWDFHMRALEEYQVTRVEDLPDLPHFRFEEVKS